MDPRVPSPTIPWSIALLTLTDSKAPLKPSGSGIAWHKRWISRHYTFSYSCNCPLTPISHPLSEYALLPSPRFQTARDGCPLTPTFAPLGHCGSGRLQEAVDRMGNKKRCECADSYSGIQWVQHLIRKEQNYHTHKHTEGMHALHVHTHICMQTYTCTHTHKHTCRCAHTHRHTHSFENRTTVHQYNTKYLTWWITWESSPMETNLMQQNPGRYPLVLLMLNV